ncbi:MAG: VanZ domain-containing protein [Shouchella clausii]|jgi:hypothetical protein
MLVLKVVLIIAVLFPVFSATYDYFFNDIIPSIGNILSDLLKGTLLGLIVGLALNVFKNRK